MPTRITARAFPETLSRWAWVSDDNPRGFTLADAAAPYALPEGRVQPFPTRTDVPAADWLRQNPHDLPLGQIALEWIKDDGSSFVPEDVRALTQVLDLWRGVITSRYELGGAPVEVKTAVDPASDTIAVNVESPLVAARRLRVRLAFPARARPRGEEHPASRLESSRESLSRISKGIGRRARGGVVSLLRGEHAGAASHRAARVRRRG